jgi:hypothetical protein
MKAVADVQCGKDASHEQFDLRAKRCRECRCGLQKKCPDCEKVVSYSNAAKHAKHCKEGAESVRETSQKEAEPETANVVAENGNGRDRPSLRVGYLAAEWDIDQGTMPAGQFCAPLCKDFPDEFRKIVVKDPTGDVTVVDAYDAIWGTIFAGSSSSNVKLNLVKTFRTVGEVLEAATKPDGLPAMDVLIMGNWAYPTAFKDDIEGKNLAREVLQKLQELEVDCRLRIFPPLDYVWHFVQKVHYYNKLSLAADCLGQYGVHVIPTVSTHAGGFPLYFVLIFSTPDKDACPDGSLLEGQAPRVCQGTRRVGIGRKKRAERDQQTCATDACQQI